MKPFKSQIPESLRKIFYPNNGFSSFEEVQKSVLDIAMFIFLVLGVFAYIAGMVLSIVNNRMDLVILDTSILTFFIYLYFSKKATYNFKALYVVFCAYILGLYFLVTIGHTDVGDIWLFSSPIIASLLFKKKIAIRFLILNIITVIFISYFISIGWLQWFNIANTHYSVWISHAANFILLNSAVTIIVVMIVENIHKTLNREKAIIADLDIKRQELLTMNSLLEQEIAERKEIESCFDLAQNIAGLGHMIFDMDTQIANGSKEFCEFFQIAQEDSQNIPLEKLKKLIIDEHPQIESEFNRMIEQNIEIDIEFKINANSHYERYLHANTRLIRDEKGTPLKFIAICLDVSERKKNELVLKDRELRYRQAFENSPNLRYSLDINGFILNWNNSGNGILGIGKEIIGRHFSDIMFDEDNQFLLKEMIDNAIQNKLTELKEITYKNLDGEPVITSCRVYIIEDAEGKLLEIALTNRDIRIQKEAESALKKSEERLKHALDATSEGIWDWEIKSDRMYFSPKFYQIIGISENELEPTMNAWRKLLHPDDEKYVILEFIKSLSKKNDQLGIEFRLRHKNGEWVWMHCRGKVVEWDKDGRPRRMVGIQRDITESKHESLIQKVVYDIANATNYFSDLEGLFPVIKGHLSKIVDTTNFFIALYNEENDTITLPFFIDEKDTFSTFPAEKTLTAYLIKNNIPLLLSKPEIIELEDQEIVDSIGSMPEVWMGVPLRMGNEVIGAIVIQNYEDPDCYKQNDMDVLQFVSDQVAIAVYKKQAEGALAKSEEQYRTLTNKLPVGIYRTTRDGKFWQANPALANMLGYDSVQELLKVNVNEMMISGNLRKFVYNKDKNAQYYSQEVQLRTKKGDLIWGQDTGTTYLSEDGSFEYFDGIIENTTEWKLAEEALKDSEKKFRALFENMVEGFSLSRIIVDENQVPTGYEFVEVNEALCRIIGCEKNNLIGKSCCQKFNSFGEDKLPVFGKIALQGGNYQTELWSEEDQKWYLISVFSPLKEYFAVIIDDITKRKWYEHQITNMNKELEIRVLDRTAEVEKALSELQFEVIERQRAQEELQKAKEDLMETLKKEKELNELKTNFISMVSHEYRTPLTVILSSTYILDVLFERKDKHGYAKNIEKIQQSVKEMTRLLEDVLIVGKNHTGLTEKRVMKVDIVNICDSLIDEIKIIDRNNHPISAQYTVNQKIVLTDMVFIQHIIRNILLNAVKYSLPGSPVILSLTDELNLMRIEIRDTGIGIVEEDMPNLFQPFHRGSNVGSISGSGLGLAIVKRYVDALMGRIKVKSKKEEGTTFIVELPSQTIQN